VSFFFEILVRDMRTLLRLAERRDPEPSTVVLDARMLRSTPESGTRAGYDGHKRTHGSKAHMAVDTLGHLLALRVTAASEQDRAEVERLAAGVQEATGGSVELAYVDRGYTGDEPAWAAKAQGIRLEVVKHPEAKRGFVLLPRRWVVERRASLSSLAFAGSPATTSAYPGPWSGSTTSPSLASYFTGSSAAPTVRTTL
jgi:transposase